MPQNKATIPILVIIITAFLIIGTLYAIYTPEWQTPDEPAHYNYIAQVAEEGCCPVIAMGDWDSAYLDELKGAQFPEDADLSLIEYEDHQPPLYYIIGAVVYQLTGGSLLALRLMSLLMGAGVVLTVYFALARLFPRQRIAALAGAAFVAFLPQHIAMMASVNNDSLAELIIGILTVVAVTYLGNPSVKLANGSEVRLNESMAPHAAAMGALAGAAFMTKLTVALPAVAIAAAAIVIRWRLEKYAFRQVAIEVAWSGGLALAIGTPWWIRNILVYGWPDFLGQQAHNAVVVGQLRTAELLADIGLGAYLKQLVLTTFHSYWGQFGWMAVPMGKRVYLLAGVFFAVVLMGLALLPKYRKTSAFNPQQKAGLWVLTATAAATLFNFAYYNATFVQFQGRYLFPAIIPASLLIVLGLWGWKCFVEHSLKSDRWMKLTGWIPLLGVIWMPVLAIYALLHDIIPNLG